MREIGGYFGLEQFAGQEFHGNLIAVNNGRNGLLYVLKARKISKLYIPYFLCNCISDMCDRYGYPYEYYSISKDFLPVFDKKLTGSEYLYVINYYGQISDETVLQLQQQYGNVILDNIQAFFQKPVEGVDTVYTCRKFFGVPDGGYVSTSARLDEPISTDISMDRMRHVLGRFEGNASDYYGDFKSSDTLHEELPLRYMSALTHNLMRAVDYDAVAAKRNENYAYLEKALGSRNKLELTTPVGPYCYPFYCENGMEVKRKLAEKKIYVATLWPNVLQWEGTLEKDYAENILPLPCDQRYDANDMERMIKEVLACIS